MGRGPAQSFLVHSMMNDCALYLISLYYDALYFHFKNLLFVSVPAITPISC